MYNIVKKEVKYLLDDMFRLIGVRNANIPPMRLVRVSPYATILEAGEEWKSKLIQIGNLKQNNKVLDIGCGSGRVSYALLDYICKNGSYDGIDIRYDEIKWRNVIFKLLFD